MTSEPARAGGDPAGKPRPSRPAVTVDRHMVLDQLGGWRGMVDASLPTVAFIVANSLGGLGVGIWAALVSAVLVFVLRLVRRESIQQAVSGLFAVAVAVAIARASGQARDFFVPGLIRNGAIAVVLLGSIVVRWPLVGVAAEFLAPSHLGSLAGTSLREAMRTRRPPAAAAGAPREPDPVAEQHWRTDRRMVRAYGWLTLLWAMTFIVRFVVQGVFYLRSDDGDVTGLGASSIVLGLPLTGLVLVVTLAVVSRLHRHRAPGPPPA